MCEQRLEELRILADQIPNFNRVNNIDGNIVELYVDKGYAVAHTLFIDPEERVSLVRTSMIEKTEFEYHTHNQIETISVYEGTLVLTVNDPKNKKEEEIILNVGDVYVVQKGIPHKAYSPVRTKMIVQIIPSPKGFLKNGRVNQETN